MSTEMTSGYSLADIGAMLGNKSDGFLEGNGIIILILFFLIFGANGGGFGGWGGTAAAAATNQINNDFLFNNLSNQYRDLAGQVAAGFAGTTEQHFGLQRDIQAMSAQMAQQCCDLKTAMHAEGEATRALLTEQEMSRLRTDLQSAQLALSNANQTQNILNNLGSYQPYAGGCNCNCS